VSVTGLWTWFTKTTSKRVDDECSRDYDTCIQ